MPAGDGTGPMGMGPMTGRAAGFCTGNAVPGYANPIGGRGFGAFGWGRGGGWGRRNRFYATGLTGWQRAAAGAPGFGWPYPAPPVAAATTPVEREVDMLKAQAEYLESSLQEVNKRLDELQSQAPEEPQ